MYRPDDAPPRPEPGDLCACGHPFASHDMADDEPGPCYWAGDCRPAIHNGSPLCACDAYQRQPYTVSDSLARQNAYMHAHQDDKEATE